MLLCQELQQKRAQKAGEAEPRLPKDRPEARALEQPLPTQVHAPLVHGNTTHPKANNAGEWFSVCLSLGGL